MSWQNQWLSSTAAASHTVHEYFINLIAESGETVIILEYFFDACKVAASINIKEYPLKIIRGA